MGAATTNDAFTLHRVGVQRGQRPPHRCLDDPTEGTIRFRDKPLPEHDVVQLRRRVGLVFQSPTLLADTVRAELRIVDLRSATRTALIPNIDGTEVVGLISMPAR